jgi:DNA mismatch repair ATPase MutS
MKGKFYKERVEILNDRLDSINKIINLLSFTRLITFILAIIVLVYVLKFSLILAVSACIIILFAFGIQVKIFIKKNKKKNHTINLIDINKNEINALNYKYDKFGSGREYINTSHPYSFDLDIFGNGSLFQFLNRTSTRSGSDKLAFWLSTPDTNQEYIIKKQESIKELSAMIDCRQNFLAAGKQYNESETDMNLINKWLNEPPYYNRKIIFRLLSLLLPVITISVLITGIIIPFYINFFVLLFLLQLLITILKLRHNNSIHSLIGKRLEILRKFDELFAYIENEKFESEILLSLQNKLMYGNTSAHISINKLAAIVSAFDNRLNLLVGILLNGIILWDIQCIIRLERWTLKYKDKIPQWFQVLAEFDAFSSLANYHFNFPDQVFPSPSTKITINAKDLGHPLINSLERVTNNFSILNKNEFVIITGANMTGKSTFLRTIGVNLVLALCGAPVCASKLDFKVIKLFTSMRTNDSLQKHESYFYAELKRLKGLIEKLKKKEKIFILLDEILKGTNSADKQKGSKAILEKLIKLKGTGVIATHDLELTKSEKKFPANIKNKCFEVEIDGAKIMFDYKLTDGITKKMNAILLMKQMGILIE